MLASGAPRGREEKRREGWWEAMMARQTKKKLQNDEMKIWELSICGNGHVAQTKRQNLRWRK